MEIAIMSAFRFVRRSRSAAPRSGSPGVQVPKLDCVRLDDRIVPAFAPAELFTKGFLPPPPTVIQIPGQAVGELVVADFNADGRDDFYGSQPGGLRVEGYLSKSTDKTSYLYRPVSNFLGSPPAMTSGDINGDGTADLVVGSGSFVSIYAGGNGGLSLLSVRGVDPNDKGEFTSTIGGVAVGDFNNDKRQDIFVTLIATPDKQFTSYLLLLNDGSGTVFNEVKTAGFSKDPSNTRAVAGDFNGDGQTDVAFTNSVFTKRVTVLAGTGTGSFGAGVTIDTAGAVTELTVADVNGDKRADIFTAQAVGGAGGAVGVHVSQPAGFGFTTIAQVNLLGRGTGVAVADFDGDGFADIAAGTTNGVVGQLEIYLGTDINGSSFKTAFNAGPYGPQDGPTGSIAVADLDKNGTPDLVVGVGLSNNTQYAPYYNKSSIGGEVILTLNTGDDELTPPLPEDFTSEFGGPVEYTVVVCPIPSTKTLATGEVELFEQFTTSSGQVTFNSLGTAPLEFGSDPSLGTTQTVSFARFRFEDFTVGTHTVIAKYLPDTDAKANGLTDNTSSQSGLSVTKLSTNAGITVDVPEPVFGQSVTISTTVTPADKRISITPTGIVLFFDNGSQIGSATLKNGVASINVPDFELGNHSLVIQYLGEDVFVQDTSLGLSLDVSRAKSTIQLAIDKTSGIFGDTVTLTAPVAVAAPGVGTPTGTVDFFRDDTKFASAGVAGGVATLKVPQLPVGSYTFTAKFNGNISVAESPISDAVGTVIGPNISQASLSATPVANRLGQTVTLSAQVLDRDNRPVEVGTVTFFGTDGAGKAVTVGPVNVSGGFAKTNLTTLPLGSASFTAKYTGTNSITDDDTAAVNLFTDRALASITTRTDTGDKNVVFGKNITIETFLIPPETVTTKVTGTVTFRDNGVVIGTAPVTNPLGDARGRAAITARLPLGTRTITADFSGDPIFAPQGPTTVINVVRSVDGKTFDPITAGAGVGGKDIVRVFNGDGSIRKDPLFAFGPDYDGGARVAAGDFNGDGVQDRLIGTGPGTQARIRILDGATDAPLFETFPFEGFTGGVFVSAGDVNGDLRPDFVVTPDQGGGPRVTVFNGDGFGILANFFGIDDKNFRGGARAAVGDINGDATGDLVVAAGFGGGPRVAVFDGRSLRIGGPIKLFNDFFAFEQTLRNGVFVAAGDVDGDGMADITFGGGPGGGPRVIVVSGKDLMLSNGATLSLRANFFAGDPNSRGGVPVANRFLDEDNKADVVAGSGPGSRRVTSYLAKTLTPTSTPPTFQSFDAFDDTTAELGGVFVG